MTVETWATLAKFGVRIHHSIGKQHAGAAEFAVVADVVARVQNRAATDLDAFPDDTMRADVRGGINLRRARDDGRGMNPGGLRWLREKQCERFGKGDTGVFDADEHFASARSEIATDDDGRGGGLFGAGEEFLVFRESKVASLGPIGRREAFKLRLPVPKHLTLKLFSNGRGRKNHKSGSKSHVDLKNFRHYKDAQQQFNLYFIWPKLCELG